MPGASGNDVEPRELKWKPKAGGPSPKLQNPMQMSRPCSRGHEEFCNYYYSPTGPRPNESNAMLLTQRKLIEIQSEKGS